MSDMTILGHKEHRQICYCFAQLEAFGALEWNAAILFLEEGWLKVSEVSVLPLTEKLTVIELTPEGRKSLKAHLKLWTGVYLPHIDEADWVFRDEYILTKSKRSEFALTQDRFDSEVKAGNLSEVIARCTPIMSVKV